MRKSALLLIGILCISLNLNAQKFEWLYSNTTQFTGGPNNLVKSDAQGNTFIIGRYNGYIIHGNDSLQSAGGGSLAFFLTKIDPAGNRLWTKTFSPFNSSINDMCIDSNGFVYATLFCNSNLTYDDGDTTFNFPGLYSIVSFDNDGNVRWGMVHPFPASWQPVTASLQHSGFYTSGYSGICKINKDGIIEWTKIASPITIHFNGIECNDDNTLVVSGMPLTAGAFTLDTVSVTMANINADLAVFRMDTTGSVMWGKVLPNIVGGGSYYYQKEFLVSSTSEIYHLYLKDNGVLNYVFGNDTILNPFAPLASCGAVLKMDSNGDPLWASGAVYGQGNLYSFNDFVLNDDEDVVICGTTSSGLTVFGPFSFNEQGSGYSVFAAKVRSDGTYAWLKSDPRIGGTGAYDYAIGICEGLNNTTNIAGVKTLFLASSFHIGCLSDPNPDQGIFVANISENAEPVPLVEFDFYRDGLTVYFEEMIENGTNYQWSFGNSQTSANHNPSHSYASPGSYNVCLTASNNCGTGSKCIQLVLEGLDKVIPDQVASSGYHKLQIKGGFATDPTLVKFIRTGSPDIIPDTLRKTNSGLLEVNVKLVQADIGFYDLVYHSPSFSDTLINALMVEPADSLKPFVTVTGPAIVRPNTWAQMRITVTNPSNVSYYGIPVYITLPPNMETFLTGTATNDTATQNLTQLIGTHFAMVYNSDFSDSLLFSGLLISEIQPGESRTITLFVRAPVTQTNIIRAYVAGSYFSAADLAAMDLRVMTACNFLPKCVQCALDLLGLVPAAGCGVGVFNLGCAIGGKPFKGASASDYFFNIALNASSALLSCATGVGGPQSIFSSISNTMAGGILADFANSVAGAAGTCVGSNGCDPFDSDDWVLFTSNSFDPNYKTGPQGFTPENFINKNDILDYTIHFENLDTATAPASEVFIIDTLDVNLLDLSTFAFTGFGQTDSVVNFNVPLTEFATEINLQPGKNAILRVSGVLDTLTGAIRWAFRSLDPLTTELAPLLNDGFLNPNVSPPEGEGFVSFKVKLKNNVSHLQQVNNTALIYFDNNAPIITNVYLNTIDTVKPTSSVLPLPINSNDTVFTLKWTGFDADAGINRYDIFVSENDSPYVKLISLTSRDSVVFYGTNGSKYEFYSIARDHARNIEDAPVNPDINPDASTTITVGVPEAIDDAGFNLYPNPADGMVFVNFESNLNDASTIIISDMIGKDQMRIPTSGQKKMYSIDISKLNAGIYSVRLIADEPKKSKQFIKLP
jgi:PKD repeat protein